MKAYHELTYLRNRSRVHDLRTFRQLVATYYDRLPYDLDDRPADWDEVQAARAEINRLLPRIVQIVEAARLGPGGAGGEAGFAVGRPEALQHIFTDRYVRSGGQEVLDVIDMTIGVYEASRYSALGRTVNPMFYVGGVLGFVLGLPGGFLRALGLVRPASHGRVQTAEVKRLEAVASRLADTEEVIEMRIAELRDQHARELAEHAHELTELAERLDFTERVLAQQRADHQTPPDSAAPSGRA